MRVQTTSPMHNENSMLEDDAKTQKINISSATTPGLKANTHKSESRRQPSNHQYETQKMVKFEQQETQKKETIPQLWSKILQQKTDNQSGLDAIFSSNQVKSDS